MTEWDLKELLEEAIDLLNEDDRDDCEELRVDSVNSFEREGLLTHNEGVVISS